MEMFDNLTQGDSACKCEPTAGLNSTVSGGNQDLLSTTRVEYVLVLFFLVALIIYYSIRKVYVKLTHSSLPGVDMTINGEKRSYSIGLSILIPGAIVREQCPSLTGGFYPHPLLPNGHLQTLCAAFIPKHSKVDFVREIV
jgi:hypothetical protein